MRVSFGGIKAAHTAFCIPRDTIEDLNQPSLVKKKSQASVTMIQNFTKKAYSNFRFEKSGFLLAFCIP